MSPQVFLAPCDPGNFDRTVLSEVDMTEYPDRPEEFAGLETVRFWGAREGSQNENYFQKMQSGDLVLFYQDGTYVGAGWIGRTFEDESKWASTTFWNGAPSTLIYTIENFSHVAVPKRAVNHIFGYAEGYNPQGLLRVAESKVNRRPKVIKRALEKYTEKHR